MVRAEYCSSNISCFISFCYYSSLHIPAPVSLSIRVLLEKLKYKYKTWNWWGWELKAPSYCHNYILFWVLWKVAIKHIYTHINTQGQIVKSPSLFKKMKVYIYQTVMCLSNSVLIIQGKMLGHWYIPYQVQDKRS